MIKHHNIIRRY